MADVVENMNVLAKEVFGDEGVPNLIPNGTKLQQKVPFSKKEALGKLFIQAVRVAYPTGFTHAKGDGTAGAFSLNDSIGGTQARAQLNGYQTLLRDQMSYEDAASVTGSKQAFVDGTKYFIEGLQESMRKRLEAEFFYGAQGLGTVASVSVSGNATITMTTALWASGIWVGNEGMQLDAYVGSTSSQRNTNATMVLVSVDTVNRKIVVSGNSTDLNALAANDTIYFRAAYGVEMTGLHGIINNTGSLFNINATTYSLWGSTQYAPSSGAFTFAKFKKAVALGVAKGLDEDLVLFLNPLTWDDVNTDISALRRLNDKDVNSVDIGSEEISYHSQNGKTLLVPSMYVWEGYAYGLTIPHWKRIGAYDVSFETPGFGGQMFIHLQTKAGVESRTYTHQAIFCYKPGKQFLVSNIVNTVY
jgi:hypothetical protein